MEIEVLKKQIAALNDLIKIKDQVIAQLQTMPVHYKGPYYWPYNNQFCGTHCTTSQNIGVSSYSGLTGSLQTNQGGLK